MIKISKQIVIFDDERNEEEKSAPGQDNPDSSQDKPVLGMTILVMRNR
jgi:hypothetical protein